MEQQSKQSLEKNEPGLSRTPFDNVSEDTEEHVKGEQPSPPITEEQWVSGIKLFVIMVAITFPCMLLLLDISIIVTAIPRITNDFHSLADVGWYGAAYMISSAVLQPLNGKFYTNFNSKWTFLSFFLVFELGSLVCGVATSSKMLIVGRAIAGMGSSGILNGAFTIVAGCVPMPKRPALIGFVTGVSQLGLILGPLIGGALTEEVTWRWCFYLNLPIGGLVVALIIFVHIPDQIPKPPPMTALRSIPTKFDLVGFAIFAPAAVMLLLATQYGGNTYPWNSPQIIGLFCGSGSTFIIWVAYDCWKGDEAMVPMSMLRKRRVWSSCLTYGFVMGQLFCVSYYLPIYFQGVKGATPLLSGVYVLPSIVTHVIFGLSSGWLVGKIGYYLPFSVAGSSLVAIGNGLLSTFSPGTSTANWIGYQIVVGAGRGLAMQMPVIAVQNTLPPAQIPVAMALTVFSQAFGGAVFLSLSDTIFTNSLATLIREDAPSVNATAIVNAGATGFRSLVDPTQLEAVLRAYSKAVDHVFYFTAGLAVASFIFGWFMGFKDIRRKNPVSKLDA